MLLLLSWNVSPWSSFFYFFTPSTTTFSAFNNAHIQWVQQQNDISLLLSVWLTCWEENKSYSRFFFFLGLHLSKECKNVCNLKTNTCSFLHISLYKLDASHDNRNPSLTVYFVFFSLTLLSQSSLTSKLFFGTFQKCFMLLQHSLKGGFRIYQAASLLCKSVQLWHSVAII